MGGLGFKDLRIFNQALLARQAWRLIQYPESLCASTESKVFFQEGVWLILPSVQMPPTLGNQLHTTLSS
jgi:hypothetical protein